MSSQTQDSTTVVQLSKVPDWVEKFAGFRPNRSTIFRWHKRGCNGKRLSTFKVGGRRCTTVASLVAFFSDDDTSGVPPMEESGAKCEAEDYLESEGL